MKSLKALTSALLLVLISTSFAMPVSIDDVYAVAQTHIGLNRDAQTGFAAARGYFANDLAISQVVPLGVEDGEAPAYVVLLDPTGYILISGDNDVQPVMAYSFESSFETEPSKENFPLAVFLLDAQNRIAAIPTMSASYKRCNNELWHRYIEGSHSLFAEHTSTIIYGPYTDTRWNQGDPYNIFCPIDPETGERCPIGCVVTAMGQIMNYWEWPPSVTFDTTDSYISDATTPTIFIDAPTANMDTVDYNSSGIHPDDTTMARLLFACGVAIDMIYQDGGSMAYSHNVVPGFLDHFGYLTADGIMPSSPTFYTDLLLDVMDGRTPYMSIRSPEVGHGVVIDGWRETGEFHVNFGWGGTADAWYFLPESLAEDLTIVDFGIVNITPPVITHMPVENLVGDAIMGGHVMLTWEAPINITEPVLRYNIYRREVSDLFFDFIGNTHALRFMDRYPPELKLFEYAVSAVYCNDVESKFRQVQVFTEIHDGWNRVVTGPGDETPNDVTSNGIGGFVAVGSQVITGSGNMNVYLVNISVSGNVIWTATYGGSEDDCGFSIERTGDGGYIVAGYTESFGAGGKDAWLLKLDADGDTTWTATYGGTGDDCARDVILSAAGGYSFVGCRDNGTEEEMSITKIDASGIAEWTRTFDGFEGYSHFEGSGGTFYIGGFYTDGPIGNHDAMLMKTDSSDSIWTRAYGGANLDEILSIVPSGDGGAVMAGITRSYGIPMFTSIYIVRTDSDGDTLWTRNYGGMKNFSANCLVALNDGFLTIGSIVNSGNKDVYLLYADMNGDTIKSHTYSTAATDIGYAAVSLPDSSLAVVGRTFSYISNNFWMLKIGGPVSPVAEVIPQKPVSTNISAYPNPFNSAVTISVEEGLVPSRVEIFDIAGRMVANIPVGAGLRPALGGSKTHPYVWTPDASLGSGVYLVRATVGDMGITKRVVYLK